MDPKTRSDSIASGILWANVTALGLILVMSLLVYLRKPPSIWTYPGTAWITSSFVVIPMLMGIIATRIWRDAKLSRGEMFGYSIVNLLVAIVLSSIALREGVICLVMALPLLVVFLLIGNLIGCAVNNTRSRMQMTITPFLLGILVVDTMTTHGYDTDVTDSITINAPPSIVWHYVIDYPAITEPSGYWLCKLGLPGVVQSTSTSHAVGATRRCIFTGDIAFDEQIAEMEHGKRLTFIVSSQPQHPEIVGHIMFHKGEFILQDNKNGTTTLIGTSWYTLNVHPAEYFDLWAKDVIRNVHSQVFNHIKLLSEQEQASVERSPRH